MKFTRGSTKPDCKHSNPACETCVNRRKQQTEYRYAWQAKNKTNPVDVFGKYLPYAPW